MQYFNYDLTNFKGINTSTGSILGNPVQVINWDYGTSKDSSTLFYGFLHKYPDLSVLGDTIASSATRGLHLFLPSISGASSAYRYLQGFSDGTMRFYNSTSDTWVSINSGFTTQCPFSFVDFNYLDRVFYSNGRDAIKKWGRDWTAGATLSDKSGTPVAITGLLSATFGSDIVTAISGAFTTELYQGVYIRREATDDWYEVIGITDDNQLQISMEYFGTTGYGTGSSQKAATSLIRARYLAYFNDRLFLASGDVSSLPLVGTAIVGATTTPLP